MLEYQFKQEFLLWVCSLSSITVCWNLCSPVQVQKQEKEKHVCTLQERYACSGGAQSTAIFCQPQSYGLYLGVWARVKRRLCRLMLRFISSFLNRSGEFRGDPRGESLGETFGDPEGEPALDLGMSWMMGSLVSRRSFGLSPTSACSSSELSEHSSLMVDR